MLSINRSYFNRGLSTGTEGRVGFVKSLTVAQRRGLLGRMDSFQQRLLLEACQKGNELSLRDELLGCLGAESIRNIYFDSLLSMEGRVGFVKSLAVAQRRGLLGRMDSSQQRLLLEACQKGNELSLRDELLGMLGPDFKID